MRALQSQLKAFAGQAVLQLGLLSDGDVHVKARHPQRLAMGVAQDDQPTCHHPNPVTRPVPHTVFVFVIRGEPVPVGLPVTVHGGQIVGVGQGVQLDVQRVGFPIAIHGPE